MRLTANHRSAFGHPSCRIRAALRIDIRRAGNHRAVVSSKYTVQKVSEMLPASSNRQILAGYTAGKPSKWYDSSY